MRIEVENIEVVGVPIVRVGFHRWKSNSLVRSFGASRLQTRRHSSGLGLREAR